MNKLRKGMESIREDSAHYADFLTKRVLEPRLNSRSQSISLNIARIVKTFFTYRSLVIFASKGTAKHTFAILDVRPGHMALADALIEAIKPDSIITENLKIIRTVDNFKIQKIKHATFFRRTKWILRLFLQFLPINRLTQNVSQTLIILNYLLKFEIDQDLATKVPAQPVVISAISVELMRGLVVGMRKSNAIDRPKFVTFQHGIPGNNGGIADEWQSDYQIMWGELYAQKIREMSKLVLPPKMISACHPVRLTSAPPPEIGNSTFVYISSPALKGSRDIDADLMKSITRAAQILNNRGYSAKFYFKLHPSKNISDYPFLSSKDILKDLEITGSNFGPQVNYLMYQSTSIFELAAAGKRVFQVTRQKDRPTFLFTGIPEIVYEDAPSLSKELARAPMRTKFDYELFFVNFRGRDDGYEIYESLFQELLMKSE